MSDLENRLITISEEITTTSDLLEASQQKVASFLATNFHEWVRYEERRWMILDDASKEWQHHEESGVIAFFNKHITFLVGNIATHRMLISFVGHPLDTNLISKLKQCKHHIDQVDYMQGILGLLPNLLVK